MDDGVCFYWREVAPPISHTVVHVSCILAVSCKLTVRPGRRAEAREHPRARGRPEPAPPMGMVLGASAVGEECTRHAEGRP